MSHSNLKKYYMTVWALTFIHKYSISDIEDLVPYEIEVYSKLIEMHLDSINKTTDHSDISVAEYNKR